MDISEITELERTYFFKYDELAEDKRGVTESDEGYGARVHHAITSGVPMQHLSPEIGTVL